MITLKQIANKEQIAILTIFEPAYLKRKKKELENFNNKTKNFLESVKNIKIDL